MKITALYNDLLGLRVLVPHIRASTPQAMQPSALTGNKGHVLNCRLADSSCGLLGRSQPGRRQIRAVRRKEGYLGHSFRPEEAIRLTAPTLRVSSTSGCRGGRFFPASAVASSSFALLPTAHTECSQTPTPDPAGQDTQKL